MKIKNILTFGTAALLAVVLESIRESKDFEITNYEMFSDKISPSEKVKIVFLSDLHDHQYKDRNAGLLRAIQNQNPDLILIGGDMIVGRDEKHRDRAIYFLKQLPKIAPVYYANGNHEQYMKSAEDPEPWKRFWNEMEQSGIHFLENTSTDIWVHETEKLTITGLELPLEMYRRFKKHDLKSDKVFELVGMAEQEQFQILLAHNPVYFSAYKQWGADLVLAGHLHGGIVRIPKWRGLITPQAFLFPKYSGEMTEEDGKVIIVSKGLGSHTVRFRICNKPELISLTVQGKESK